MSQRNSPALTYAHLDGAVSTIRGDIREFVKHFNDSQVAQNGRLDHVDSKLDEIIEMLAMRKEIQNLVREPKVVGVNIDETKIFIT